MATVRLDGRVIGDWASFHHESRVKFGFPDFYGNNMDAWIDCLSTLCDTSNEESMAAFTLAPDETLRIEVTHCSALRQRAPEILNALEECVAAVNQRYRESGEKPALELHFR